MLHTIKKVMLKLNLISLVIYQLYVEPKQHVYYFYCS